MDIYASDEEKGEEIKQWWRDNGRSVVIACVLGAIVIFGGRYWINYTNVQSEKASQAYQQVTMLLEAENNTAADAITQTLLSEFSATPYAVFTAFEMATLAVQNKDNESAQNYLEWVTLNAKLSAHKELASLRLAQLFLLDAKFEQSLALAEQAKSTAFSSLWAELKGDVYIAQDNVINARESYETALSSLAAGEPRQLILKVKLDDVAE
ncbi:MAG: hypothetical protein COA90_05960 [Gammaproteobacteria bacterium]|nr:MAG: hypothetical protein COA90_05960 [Gammaproteobacteria bacterium]